MKTYFFLNIQISIKIEDKNIEYRQENINNSSNNNNLYNIMYILYPLLWYI